ncbi:MAG: hypothetical protein PHW24_02770 [Candidatus Moranbacteria bacterium]|nr:hypothetical protein [Candidatus Moranbacteria bacterium]
MEKIKEKYFYPMSVSAIFGHDDTKDDIILRWDKFDLLSDEEKKVLISENVPIVIKKIADQFNLQPMAIEEISRIVRGVYFKNIFKDDLSDELGRRIPSIGFEGSQKIAQILNDEIFNLKLGSNEELEAEKKKFSFIQIALFDALEKYPNLGEQIVGDKQLKMQDSQLLVRPSIKNWIKDFHDAMGAGKHSPIDRGNFLFHSENGKNLSASERQKMAIILKSLDEQTLVTINEAEEKIVFDEVQKEVNSQQSTVSSHQSAFSAGRSTVNSQQPVNLPVKNQQSSVISQQEIARENLDNDQTSLPDGHPPRVDKRSFPRVEAGLSSSEERMGMKKSSEIETFFSVPGSKPPIGSDSFFVEDGQKDFEIEKEPMKSEVERGEQKETFVSPTFLASPNNIKFSSPQKLPTEQLAAAAKTMVAETKIQIPVAEPKDILDAPKEISQPSRSPFHIGSFRQGTEQENDKIKTIMQNPAPAKPQISFAELRPKTQAPEPAEPLLQTTAQFKRPAAPSHSPFHIEPSKNDYRDSDEGPRIKGNVVDLS